MCHTKEEHNESVKQFKNNINHHFNQNSHQYIADFEETDSQADNEVNDKELDDIEKQMKDLILDIDTSSEPDMSEFSEILTLTFISILNTTDVRKFVFTLADQAFIHIITGLDVSTNQPESNEPIQLNESMTTTYNFSHRCYSDRLFHEIMIDTDAAIHSTVKLEQFSAFSKIHDNTQINKTKSYTFQFDINSISSISIVIINTSIDNIHFHIVEADISFILCLHDMKTLDIYLDNI